MTSSSAKTLPTQQSAAERYPHFTACTERIEHNARRKPKIPWEYNDEVVDELDRLAQWRFGGTELPDNEQGEKFALIVASHLREPVRIRRVLGEIAPWYDEDEVEKLTRRVTLKQYRWRAATIAKWLNVTWAEHEALGLRLIDATDRPASVSAAERAERTARKRERDRRKQQRLRRERGAKPRAAYEAESLSQTQPWKLLGYKCRRTWERHGKPMPESGVASASPSILLRNNGDALATRSARAARPHLRQMVNTSRPLTFRDLRFRKPKDILARLAAVGAVDLADHDLPVRQWSCT